jgi:tetratricopeptide (TPR) repeat protein
MDTDVKKGDLCPFCGRADRLRRSVIDRSWICYNCGKSFDTPGRPGDESRGQTQIAESQLHVVNGEGEIDNVDLKTETPSETVPILAKDHRSRALNYMLRDKWDDAIEEYSKAIELDDNWVLAHYERGELFKRLDKKADAIADFEKVISLSRDRETLKPAHRNIEELKK